MFESPRKGGGSNLEPPVELPQYSTESMGADSRSDIRPSFVGLVVAAIFVPPAAVGGWSGPIYA